MFHMQTSPASLPEAGATIAIAVSGGRHSHSAVKWAVEHLLKKNTSCILIHVQTKSIQANDDVDVAKHGRAPTEEELHQLFLPFRGFCARKGIAAKELVLYDVDIPKALTNYVVENFISTLVVGSDTSSWNINTIMSRKFSKDSDVPTSLAKSLPENCKLYVIAKGKVQLIRPAGHPHYQQEFKITPTKSIRDIVTLLNNAPMVHPHKNLAETSVDSDDNNRKSIEDAIGRDYGKVWESLREMKEAIETSSHKSNEGTHSPRGPAEYSLSQNSSARSSHENSDSTGQLLGSPMADKSHGSHEIVVNSDKHRSLKPQVNFEMEMRKLKLELWKTTEKYSMACKEAVIAQQKAMELEKCRQEKERGVEEARHAEEIAFALAEIERQKAKAAMESAEMSQRLAEMETLKRKEIELRAKREEKERNKEFHEVVCNSIPCRRYKIEELEAATNNFDEALKIGEGGYGPVFRGVIDHTIVAIKALRPNLAHGERQFQQEVIVLSTIRHPSMVLLLGACPEYGCLVYEYMENGSLEDRLFRKMNTPPIPWKTRFKIASEIATGLLFLHQRKPEPLVHRDLKPANILLGKNYVSKISDVGLARLVPPSVGNKTTQYRLTGAAGTFCYIDPEYQQTGLLGVKSDIYSLGVVLLQIITGKPPMGLAHLVEKALDEGTFGEVLDPSITDWPVEETMAFAKLALKCCELRKRDRPDLATVFLPELNRISGIWDSDEQPLPGPRRHIHQYHPHVSGVEYHRALLHAGVHPLVAHQHLPAHTQGTPRNARPQPPPRLQGPPGHIAFRLVCQASTFGGLIGSFDSIVSQLRRDTGCKIHCEDSVAATEDRVILSPHRPLELTDGHVDVSNTQEAVVRVFKRVWELKAEKANRAVNSDPIFSKLLAHTLRRMALSLAKEGEEEAAEGDDVEAARIACRSWGSSGRGEGAVEIEELVMQ
ncbi:hypothetical protein Fmac_012357 [Flemingia macrophylla]|uniref:RING-type E3 ubiquitin transferase n=1 Tax=Flemingia macrophylla TaxID=520843 RepID=A0ABD1MQ33_9FABA